MPSELEEHIGLRIRRRRLHLGLTQDALARDMDVSYQQVQKYEAGANRISASRLLELARVMDVPIDYFFDGHSPKGPADAESIAHSSAAIETCRSLDSITQRPVRQAVDALLRAIAARQRP